LATQRRFEAHTLAAVLAKVQKEVGPDATISSAQRIRSGGTFGFFQREKFEVLVTLQTEQERKQSEAQPSDPAESPEARAAEILSVLDLAEIANTADINEVHMETSDEEPPKVEEPRVEPTKVETTIAEPEVLTPDSEPRISTETESFAEVLSRVAYQAHANEEQELSDQRRQMEDDIPDRPAFLNTIPSVGREITQPAPQLPEVIVPQQRTRISDHPLAQLGLPSEYIPIGVELDQMQEALGNALERLLPKAPDIRPSKGSVIAIVGERFDAMDIAEALAEQWGRPSEEIVLASQTYRGKGAANVLRTVRNAEDAQRSWSRRPRPTIVAIEAEPGSRDAGWAEHILTALEPIATYGVADATRKSDDIKAWSEALGGIDALAVNNVEETVSPAAILATGIPIDRVDGRRVTPAFWALLLTERLAAA
jgi:hypothetical protein